MSGDRAIPDDGLPPAADGAGAAAGDGAGGGSGPQAFSRKHDQEKAADRRPPEPRLRDMLASLLHDIPGMFSDRVRLAALELQRARQALIRMVALAMLAAILAATAWITFWAMLVAIAVRLGMPWYGALALVLLLNCAGAWFAVRRARALAAYLALPATMRRLTISPKAGPVTPASVPPQPRPAAEAAAADPTQPGATPA